jgi:hypothetical protein
MNLKWEICLEFALYRNDIKTTNLSNIYYIFVLYKSISEVSFCKLVNHTEKWRKIPDNLQMFLSKQRNLRWYYPIWVFSLPLPLSPGLWVKHNAFCKTDKCQPPSYIPGVALLMPNQNSKIPIFLKFNLTTTHHAMPLNLVTKWT